MVSERSTESHSVVKGENDCEDINGASTSATHTLEYGGSKYAVPKGLLDW